MLTLRAILLIARRSLRQHALSTVVTALSVALGAGLVMSVVSIREQSYRAFTEERLGFDAVLGARGSQLQLVLNAIFHLETSPGNIPWSMYQAVLQDRSVAFAVPYALGDNYYGFRIVGTEAKLFEQLKFRDGGSFAFEGKGRVFNPARREAIVGSFAAKKAGLARGSKFSPFHGLNFDPSMQHTEEYVVVGVLKPTNTPADRVIWIPIEGVFRMGGHVLRGTGTEYTPEAGAQIDDEHKEVSAVLIKFANLQAGMGMEQTVNKQGKAATLAFPIGLTMASLFEKLGWMNRVLELVAWLVVAVAAGGITASIYNSISERRRDIAIMRSLGARRRVIFAAIVLESSAIALAGSIAGFLVYGAILGGTAAILRAQTGVILDVWFAHPILWLTPPGMMAIGALAGILPALKAYRTDVASNLAPVS